MGSPQPPSAGGVDPDIQPDIPGIQWEKSYGGVKGIKLNPRGTSGTNGLRAYGGETVVGCDDAAALQSEVFTAKPKGKSHPEPSPGDLSRGDGTSALLTSSETGTDKIPDSISSLPTTQTPPCVLVLGNEEDPYKDKLKRKLPHQPSTCVLSLGNGLRYAPTSYEAGPSKTCDGIMRSWTTPDSLSPGNEQNISLTSESACNIAASIRRSSEIRTTSGTSKSLEVCQTCSASVMPCQCQSTNFQSQCFDISSKEPSYLCKDRRFRNQDVSGLGPSLESNRARQSDHLSIEMPFQNGRVLNTPPGDNRTQTTSIFKAFIDGTRARLLEDPNLIGIIIVVTAEAGFALVTRGSGANTSMMATERTLLDVAGISSVLGFLCCLYSLLLRGVSSKGATVLAGLGIIAGVTGFLALMGMLWQENLKSYVAATVACIAFLTGLACLFLK